MSGHTFKTIAIKIIKQRRMRGGILVINSFNQEVCLCFSYMTMCHRFSIVIIVGYVAPYHQMRVCISFPPHQPIWNPNFQLFLHAKKQQHFSSCVGPLQQCARLALVYPRYLKTVCGLAWKTWWLMRNESNFSRICAANEMQRRWNVYVYVYIVTEGDFVTSLERNAWHCTLFPSETYNWCEPSSKSAESISTTSISVSMHHLCKKKLVTFWRRKHKPVVVFGPLLGGDVSQTVRPS